MTDHKPDNAKSAKDADAPQNAITPGATQPDVDQQQVEQSLEDHLQNILNQIEEAEPGLLEAEQFIDDDGSPRFILKPKPKVKEQPKAASSHTAKTPTPPAEPRQPAATPSDHEPIEEDELAALINQAIDQASGAAQAPEKPAPTQSPPHTSQAELERAVDRDIDQAVQQAAQSRTDQSTPPKTAHAPQAPVTVHKPASFNPADNFVPIEPDQLADAIEEAFANPSGLMTPEQQTPPPPPQATPEVTPEVAPQTPETLQAPAHSQAVNPLDTMDDNDRMSNEDLDALFADPATLLAEEQQAQETANPAASPAAADDAASTFNESDFSQAWDKVLDQAQQELARLADEKYEQHTHHLDKLRSQANSTPQLKDLLDDEKHSVFDDQAFSQQWDDVLSQARQKLSQMSSSPTDKPAVSDSGKLNNDDLTDQLDQLLAEATQAQSPSSSADMGPLDETQFSEQWDQVLGQAMTQLSQLATTKLKNEAQKRSEKIKSLRQSISDEQLAQQLDQLIDQTRDGNVADTQQPESSFDESEFATAWENVLNQAKQQHAQPSQPEPQATADENFEPMDTSIDLAGELDDLLSTAFSGADQATAQPEDQPVGRDVTASEIQEMIDTDQPAEPTQPETEPHADPVANAQPDPTTPADSITDEPQDPATMINHIDALLAEHASQAVGDAFETPEKIAEQHVSEEELEAAFQSPEQVLKNLQEASAQHTQSKAPEAAADAAQASPPAAAQVDQAQATSEEPNDLEGDFESPDDLHTDDTVPQPLSESDIQAAQTESADDDDEMMGDFVSPEQADPLGSESEHQPIEQAFESTDELLAQEAVAEQSAQPQAAPQPAAEADDPNTARPSLISRLAQTVKRSIGRFWQLGKHMGPTLDRICAQVNHPLKRFDKQTQNLVGYIGLVQIFITVILVCVIFKKMLFGD